MFFLESSLLAPCSHCPPSSSTSHSPEARNGESAFDTSLMFVLKRRPLPFRLCLFCSLPHFHSFIAHLRMAGGRSSCSHSCPHLNRFRPTRCLILVPPTLFRSLRACDKRAGGQWQRVPLPIEGSRTGIGGWFQLERAKFGSSRALQGSGHWRISEVGQPQREFSSTLF